MGSYKGNGRACQYKVSECLHPQQPVPFADGLECLPPSAVSNGLESLESIGDGLEGLCHSVINQNAWQPEPCGTKFDC